MEIYNSANAKFALTVGAILFGSILIWNAPILGDPDTYWHLGVGRWIVEHGEIPAVDLFSNSITGTRWIPHEWLTEVIFAEVYQWFGWGGLIFLTALMGGISLGVFAYFVARWVEPLHAALISALAYSLLVPHLTVRPHMLAMPLMIAFVGALVVARERRERPSLWLLPILWIWANLHGGFVLGLGFAGYFAVEAALQDGWRQGGRWLLFFILVFGCALITPNGIDGILLLTTYLGGIPFMESVIREWQSPDFQHLPPLEIWLLGFLLLSLSCGFRLPIMRSLILIGLVHLALKHSRNAEFVGFLAPLTVLPSIAPQFHEALQRFYRQLMSKAPWLYALAKPSDSEFIISRPMVAGVAVVVAGSLAAFSLSDHTRKDDAISPIAAVNAARAAGVDGPVFNSYEFGGYLIFAGIPPFIDGRGELYGDEFVERFMKTAGPGGRTELTDLLSRYKSRWALLRPDFAATLGFAALPGWRELYGDEFAVVYVNSSTPMIAGSAAPSRDSQAEEAR